MSLVVMLIQQQSPVRLNSIMRCSPVQTVLHSFDGNGCARAAHPSMGEKWACLPEHFLLSSSAIHQLFGCKSCRLLCKLGLSMHLGLESELALVSINLLNSWKLEYLLNHRKME